MSFMWFIMGAIIVGIVWVIYSWIKNNQVTLSWPVWTGMIIGILLGLFSVAWAISSIIEGENQSAGMGLLVFGGFTLIVFFLTRKKFKKDNLEVTE